MSNPSGCDEVLDGARACPPEDVGGVPGYEDALAGLRGEPSDNPEWTRELLAWLPPRYDPEHFDVAEVNTTPVLSLRESAVSLGLLRKQHGKLLPTASAKRMVDDPRKLFAHIRGRLPLGRHESDRDAGLLALLFTAAGQEFYAARHEAAGVYGSLGWTSPVSLERALWHQAQDSLCVLSHLAPGTKDATRIAGALLAR